MRKFVVIGLFIVFAVMAGAVFAQEATPEAETEVAKAWLGMRVDDEGVIHGVKPDSPADEAGLQVGDDVTSLNGTSIATGAELSELVQAAAVGDVVTVEVSRDGETVSV